MVARGAGIGKTTISEVLRLQYAGKTSDLHLVRLHNWLELAARRENLIRKRKYVEHSVATDILHVAGIVAETCKIGVVWGPSHIGKSMTLQAIEGDQRFGDPVYLRVDEAMCRPFALCRAVASRFDLSTHGTFDVVFHRVVNRLAGTKRMLMFDEVERVEYRALELIRDLHDLTGCPVLLCGKPAIYEKLGFRHLGDYSEVTDQLAARIVIRRDLTERTRGRNPRPLFTLEDVRKLIHSTDLKLHVPPDAMKWLQMRASSLGTGGLGNALACFYLAYRLAFAQNLEAITTETLESVADLTMGHEDAQRVAEVVADAGIRRVV
jgi:DNA transposition AAA+ family ATPase